MTAAHHKKRYGGSSSKAILLAAIIAISLAIAGYTAYTTLKSQQPQPQQPQTQPSQPAQPQSTQLEKDEFTEWAEDSFGGNAKYAFEMKVRCPFFYSLWKKDKATAKHLVELAIRNATLPIERNLAYLLCENIVRHASCREGVKEQALNQSLQLVEALNVTGLKRRESIYALANYSRAIVEEELPCEVDGLKLLLEACERNPSIMDFTPITIEDFFGEEHVIRSKCIPRDVWAIAKHLEYTPEILDKPEAYFALNAKVQQNVADIMSKGGKSIALTGRHLWEEILIPQYRWLFNESKISMVPLLNESKLLEWYGSKENAKLVLYILFRLEPRVADLEAYKKEGKIVYHYGLDSYEYQVKMMPVLYKKILEEYPNGMYTSPYTGRKAPYVNFYYAWITDRGYHGLKNSMYQFLGKNIIHDEGIPDLDEKYLTLNPDSINTYLSKSFEYWDLIKFIYGYGVANFGSENMRVYRLYLPIAMKTFGIPDSIRGVYYEHWINASARFACAYDDVVFGIPSDIFSVIKSKGIIPFPGNGISPLAVSKVKEDIAHGLSHRAEPNAKYFEAYLWFRDDLGKIILFKAGEKG